MLEKLIIIGSGPAGYTAAIYAARAKLNPLLFEGFSMGGVPGGQLMTASSVENFPGFPEGIQGPKLIENMRQQALGVGTRIITEEIINVKLDERPFALSASGGEAFQCHALIIATGANARRFPLDSEKAFWGRGVSACAVCDGSLPIYRDKRLAVIGGGDTAMEEALHLAQFASRVFIVHRRADFRAARILSDRVRNHDKIELLLNKTVVEFLGEKTITGLKLKDTLSGAISTLEVGGAFEAIGFEPNLGFLKGQMEIDDSGYLVTRPDSSLTSREGVFAAGDAHDKKYRQAVTAAGRGCMAAMDAERWLQEKKLI